MLGSVQTLQILELEDLSFTSTCANSKLLALND